jgi:hypothetical protein
MRARAERNGYKNGTQYNGLASQVVYGLLPTPLTNMSNRKLDENGQHTSHTTGKKYGINLNQLAKAAMLPTPTRFDYNTPRSPEAWERAKEKHGDALQVPLKQLAANGMLPTPAAQNHRAASSTEALQKRGRLKPKADSLADQFAQSGKSSQLNPRFVAEMMGFPVNWTELPFQSGEPSQSKPTETP